jgi:aryl-alcohol dehydrogenase-like predicted oxidoreductase
MLCKKYLMGELSMGSYGGEYASPTHYIDGGMGEKNARSRMDTFYTYHYPGNAAMWQQGSIDKRFKAGDQSLWSMIYGDNNYYGARRFFFNLCRRQSNMICGYQRRNRKSTVTMPIFKDDALADEYNQVLKWCEEKDGFQEYFSQAFEDAVDTGISLLHLYPDYTLDPISGDLFTDKVSYCSFLIDSYFRKQDLTDCNGIWRRRWVTKNVAKSLLPQREKEIDKMLPSGVKDGRFPLQVELLNLNAQNLFAYDEFHYRTTREATIIIDPKSGESSIWEPDEDEPEDMLEQIQKKQPWLIVKKKEIPTVNLTVSLNGRPVYDGPNLLGIDSYPFVPLLTYHEPEIQSYAWRIQGVIRNLRDAQYLYNQRQVIIMDLLQSQVQNAWIYPIDVVVDPKAFRQTQNGCLIPLKAGHLPNEIQRLDPQSIPQSVMELSQRLAEDITKISGVNEELLGSATDDKSGILSMLRQGAGLTTLQTIFDKADYSQRLYGKTRLQAIRKMFRKSKIRNILGHEADPRFWTSHALKYNVSVEEGNYSTTQRQMELQQLLHFRELGMPISDRSILNAAFITNKQEIIDEMNANSEQQSQMQKVQAEQQQQIEQSKVITAYAKAKSELAREKDLIASANEKISRIHTNEAKADHDLMESDLALVKEMIALEDADLETVRKSLEIAQAIRMANQSIKNPEVMIS